MDSMSCPEFQHYLLTRFNVKLVFDMAPQAHSGKPAGLDERWLERRFGLFETYCLPSVAAQTAADFSWLVYLDEQTPPTFRQRMDGLAARYPFLHPVYCAEFDADSLWKGIGSVERDGTAVRITSRLDNDDMLHPRYMEEVRKHAEREAGQRDLARGFFVAFPVGCCLRGRDGYVQRYRNNPFSSYVSSAGTKCTVLDVDHRYIGNGRDVVYEWTKPMWCQVIHGENVANAIRGIYWPLGREFTRYIPCGIPARSWKWKAGEVLRSAWRYWKNRGK